jgi:hypothetical protein
MSPVREPDRRDDGVVPGPACADRAGPRCEFPDDGHRTHGELAAPCVIIRSAHVLRDYTPTAGFSALTKAGPSPGAREKSPHRVRSDGDRASEHLREVFAGSRSAQHELQATTAPLDGSVPQVRDL